MNPKANFFFDKPTQWQKEYAKMRSIALDCNLVEDVKWGCPCYTLNGKNIVLIHGFKEYCAYLFFKGALLKDTDKLLIQQTKNVQSPRQIRFTNLKQIKELEKVLKTYIFQAIEVEKAGLKVVLKEPEAFDMAEEFEIQLSKSAKLKKAFYALTPGRQRAYLLHFSQPKQAKTREARVQKCIPAIMQGRGLND
ncbi:MAG: YdeI/OmpD-associated family protein [Chitinophagales bacterium]